MISRQQQIPTRILTLIFRCNPSSLEDFSPLQICFNSQAKQKTRIYVGIDFVSGDEHKSKKIELCSLLWVLFNRKQFSVRYSEQSTTMSKGEANVAQKSRFYIPEEPFPSYLCKFRFCFHCFHAPESLQWLPHEKFSNGINNSRAEKR